ncbi:hypothetical protein KONIH1_03140 [Klebsiella oxytoca KONIH1]|nr:hypothetical protein KONIH1_03140 [Klebsiella oxytoca KONIH1]
MLLLLVKELNLRKDVTLLLDWVWFHASSGEAKSPVRECYLTADTEGLRVLCVLFWLYGGGIESHRK